MDIPEVEVVNDGVVRDSRGRRHRPKSERERLARESFESGLSLVEFARREGLNYHTLIGWRYELKRRAESPEKLAKSDESESLQFAEFRLPGPSFAPIVATIATIVFITQPSCYDAWRTRRASWL